MSSAFSPESHADQAQQILEVLSTLNYRTGELEEYLDQISLGVSSLIGLDWSVVTICERQTETVMASSLDQVPINSTHALHGTLTETVVHTGAALAVDDVLTQPELGAPPPGYRAYLGVPMITAAGETIGTICSFSVHPRRFTAAEIRVAELFAERAAAAIDNYRLFQQQQRFSECLEAEVAQRTAELRRAQAKLVDKERLAAIGEFAAMIVHEIRNPITTILLGLSALGREPLSDRNQQRLALALEEAERLQNLAKEILLHGKPQTLSKVRCDLNQFLETMAERLQDMPAGAQRYLVFEACQEPLAVEVDENKLKQVLINLVRNAFEAIDPEETVTYRALKDPSGNICIQIHNGGPPIPEHVLPLLNRPFASTKLGGTGLGLAVVRRIVAAHGGTLKIQSAESHGTIVSVILPRAL